MRRLHWLLVFLAFASPKALSAEAPLLLRQPTVSATRIVFVYAGDLWAVPRTGGQAIRLTSGPGEESTPHFSPDGRTLAFTGEYDGNVDVFTIPAEGGVPKRLTWHPGNDTALGWTPDGKRILFRSRRDSHHPYNRLFTVSAAGGFEEPLPLPMGFDGTYSSDGSQLAYQPWGEQLTWKRYRGGQTPPVWIARLSDSKVEKLPRENSNDTHPVWLGGIVYFLSDRDGPVTLYSYDPQSKKVRKLLDNDGLDLKWASAGPDVLVLERFGGLYLYDPAKGQTTRVKVTLAGDFPEVRSHFESAGGRIQSASLSPTGKRALFEARGDIFSVPAEKGDVRNLTQTPGVMERFPTWSPDGKWIAYFSEASGEYALHLKPQTGKGEVKKIDLGPNPSFFTDPDWSPDSKKIAFKDQNLNVWIVTVEDGKKTKVDTDLYRWESNLNFAWSPDSRWLAYVRQLPNHQGAVFVHDTQTGKNEQITDGLSDANWPAFDRSGKYLYFMASTNAGPALTVGDMSKINQSYTSAVYLIVLQKDQPSPFAPESDEETVKDDKTDDEKKPSDAGTDKATEEKDKKETADKSSDAKKPDEKTDGKPGEKKDAAKKEEAKPVRIDFEGIGQRVLSMPIPERNYAWLGTGKENLVYILETPSGGPAILQKYDLKARKLDKAMEGAGSFMVSANGEKLLYHQGSQWGITSATAPKPSDGILKTGDMQSYVVPMDEWRQMYNEAWRFERDFFYDPNLHGLDLETAKKRFAEFLPGLASRDDLNYLFREMFGEITVSHHGAGGGDSPSVSQVGGGLLGADYEIANGRYRFKKIYSGENWNPNSRAPLTEPGVNVKEGEYLLAVQGEELRPPDNVYRLFENTAGKQVKIKVGPDPGGKDSREVTVVPIYNEYGLRNLQWIEENRRKVDAMTGGKIAYIYLPDTSGGGMTYFNRYFYSQREKEGAIVDERFNGGGLLAEYVIDRLDRMLLNKLAERGGQDDLTPSGALYGPKVMLINQFAGSGGDAMPYYFRKRGIGPLIGMRTWGGLVGVAGTPPLMDGGGVAAPSSGLYDPIKGEWIAENKGIAPDVEVEMDPYLWRQGRDPQLEKGIERVMEALKKQPKVEYHRPPFPNYHQNERLRREDGDLRPAQ